MASKLGKCSGPRPVAKVVGLGAFAALVAHEVTQPLSGIVTNAGTCLRMLAANPPDLDGARETARLTLRDGHRAAEVIARMRALFTREETCSEPVDLNEAVLEVIDLSHGELRRNRVIIRLELADNLPAVMGDRVQLQQVILNLVRNASEAMRHIEDRPRKLVVRTQRDADGRALVSVCDSGVGLEPHCSDLLFQPFYTTKSDGTGIGLFVSRSIVLRHRGRLWAAPNEGPGAVFAFSIPSHFESARSNARDT